MLADHLAVGVFNRAGFGAQMPAQEFLEGPLSDETDAGAVGLVEHREPRRVRTPAHLCLAQFADWKQRVCERRRLDAVQEIALILGEIRRLQELYAVRRVA